MLFIDTHVHYHKTFNERDFIGALIKNFQDIAARKKIRSYQSVVCFTESAGVNFFSKLVDSVEQDNENKMYKVVATRNQNSIILEDTSGFKVICISGKQIVTQENLEILALGMVSDFEDKKPIHRVIQSVLDQNCLPVLPWGFGKWTGERKKFVEEIVTKNAYRPFFLGDNGNRPTFMAMSPLMTTGLEKGIKNLQGSDPLPFRSEVTKPGSFGVIVDGSLSEETPFDDLHKILCDNNLKIESYGKLESPINFIKNQVAMQIVKRLRR